MHIRDDCPRPITIRIISRVPFTFRLQGVSFQVELRTGRNEAVACRLHPAQQKVCSFKQVQIFITNEVKLLSHECAYSTPLSIGMCPSCLVLRQCRLLTVDSGLARLNVGHVHEIKRRARFRRVGRCIGNSSCHAVG